MLAGSGSGDDVADGVETLVSEGVELGLVGTVEEVLEAAELDDVVVAASSRYTVFADQLCPQMML